VTALIRDCDTVLGTYRPGRRQRDHAVDVELEEPNRRGANENVSPRCATDPSHLSSASVGHTWAVPARSDDHVGYQVGTVRRDVAQQERVPDAVGVDAQSHHAGVLAEVDSLDHQPHQVQRQRVGCESGPGLHDEPVRRRRHRRGRGRQCGAGTYRHRPDRVGAVDRGAIIRSRAARPSGSVEENKS